MKSGRRVGTLAVLIVGQLARAVAAQEPAWLAAYREPANRLIGHSRASDFAWQRLALMGDTFGPRLSGSDALARTIDWVVEEMKKDGLERVRAEPVKVPHWVRGRESLDIVAPHPSELVLLGLGGSVGTPAQGIEAALFVVSSFAELETNAASVRGKIVLFNVPYTSYRETVQYRSNGASRAAALGAVASLVRSVAPPGLRTPHTGSLRYQEGTPRIPAAAIPTEDADRLQRMFNRGMEVRLRLRMEAASKPDADSANVVAEIRGREWPEEVVLIGAHLDSWDVGTGSSDDGAGCVATWEALRLMKQLDLRPRRTVRVVLFTNEENGLAGGRAYLERYRSQLANHVAMLESDDGVFKPGGFGFTGSATARSTVQQIASLLRGIQADRIGPSGESPDTGPAAEAGKIPSLSFQGGDSKSLILIHHTPADTVDKIDPDDMAKASAAIAVMTYVIADMPERLR